MMWILDVFIFVTLFIIGWAAGYSFGYDAGTRNQKAYDDHWSDERR